MPPLAAIGIFGFSRLGYDASTLTVDATYAKDLLPWILVMSFGMGFVFVPAHADRRPRRRRAGLGYRLRRPERHAADRWLARARRPQHGGRHGDPQQGRRDRGAVCKNGSIIPADGKDVNLQVVHVAFTHGSTIAFTVGAAMIALGAILVFAFMRVSHEELAMDGPAELTPAELTEEPPELVTTSA